MPINRHIRIFIFWVFLPLFHLWKRLHQRYSDLVSLLEMSSPNNNNSKSKTSIRWSDLSEAQRKEVVRVRNIHQCRKNRQRWKESDEEISTLFESNEKKIEDLEKMITELSKDLEGPSNPAPSSSSHPSHSKTDQSKGSPSKSGKGKSKSKNWNIISVRFIKFDNQPFTKQLPVTPTTASRSQKRRTITLF